MLFWSLTIPLPFLTHTWMKNSGGCITRPVRPPLIDVCKMRKQSFCSLPGHPSSLRGELRKPHWTKQISWLASHLNPNWMLSLPSIAGASSGLLTQDGELARPSLFWEQTRPPWLGTKRRWVEVCVGEAGVDGAVSTWPILRSTLALLYHHSCFHHFPLPDEVVSTLVIRGMSDGSHVVVNQQMLYIIYCQVGV